MKKFTIFFTILFLLGCPDISTKEEDHKPKNEITENKENSEEVKPTSPKHPDTPEKPTLPEQPDPENPIPTEKPEDPTPQNPETIDSFLITSTNSNITYYEIDKTKRATLWVKGITPPQFSDFIEIADEYNRYFAMEYKKDMGWYDVDKSLVDADEDRLLCGAAVASNMLHWWFDQNRVFIEKYLLNNENGITVFNEEIRDVRNLSKFFSQEDSEIFKLFIKDFPNRAVWANIMVDLFINGYTPPPLKISMNSEILFKRDFRGGFFYPVFKESIITDQTSAGKKYKNLSYFVREWLREGKILGISHTTTNAQLNHIITIWGAEFDLNKKLTALFITDSDDRYSKLKNGKKLGLKRLNVVEDNQGLARLTARDPNLKVGATVIGLYSLSLKTDLWEKYFSENQN